MAPIVAKPLKQGFDLLLVLLPLTTIIYLMEAESNAHIIFTYRHGCCGFF
ncbi:hypothetical protein SHLI107390_05310 [Shewanella livingstonensis]